MTPPSDPPAPGSATDVVPRAEQLRRLLVVAAGCVVVVAAGWWLTHRGPPPAEESAAPADTFHPTPQQLKTLTIEPVATHSFASVEVADGRIGANADRATAVYSPFSGRIVELRAGIGDVVAEGAPLATVEAAEFVQAENDLAVAVAQLKLTRATEARRRALYEAEGASLADVQQAEADRAAAEAVEAAVESRLRILGRPAAEIERLKAGARIEPRVPLLAPIAGVVVDRQAGPGQYLQAGAGTAVYTIADTRTVWALGSVAESAAPRLKRGQTLEVRVPAWPGRVFRTELAMVGAAVDPVTHRLAVRGVLPNADGALKPEMLATLRIVANDAAPAPAVPESAVVHEGESAHVWVVGPGDVIGLRTIRPGRLADGLVEVVEGLTAGERVVTRGSLFIDRAARHD